MTTKLDEICDVIAEQEFHDAEKLIAMMDEWSTKFHRSHRDLMKIPGFRKLWDAITEAAHLSAYA